MSRRGRSRGGRYNYEKTSAYPYQGERYHSQHDDRRGRTVCTVYNRDFSRGHNFGSYNNRGGRGGGKFRGGSRRPRASRGYRGGRGPSYNSERYSSRDGYFDEDDVEMDGNASHRPAPYSKYSRGNTKPRPNSYPTNKKQSWSLITVYEAASLDQAWVIDAIQREAMTQIFPVQYYSDGQHVSFCIESFEVAMAIKQCTKKIETPEGSKLTITSKPCDRPITDDKIPILKEVFSDRYKAEECHLDASGLFHDKTLRTNNVALKPRNPREMYIIVRLIGEHIPGLLSLDLSDNHLDSLTHLKNLVMFTPRLQKLQLQKNILRHTDVLDDIKDWDLKELNIDENPLCEKYQSQSEYVSAIRKYFPNLETLDGKKLPPPVKFDLERITKLVPALPHHLPSEVKPMIGQFVQQYFSLYDTDRKSLTQAYDENSTFSICIPSVPRGPPLSQYYNHSRNLSRMKNPKKKMATLKYPRSEVCSVICELPSTEHDISGFSVDVPFMSANILKFIIRGTFKEKRGSANDTLRAFSRTFLCLTDGKRLSIINDELNIRNVSNVERRSAFVKPPVTPSPSPVPEHATASPAPSGVLTSPNKMDMIAAFVKESGMNIKFSEQCLAENQWDYSKAGQAFLTAKGNGLIPPEAYNT